MAKKDFYCSECKMFLFSIKDDGYININTKMKKYATNTRTIKVVCKCGKTREEKL
ncbi:hypothetical protein [Cetobacterium sp.]|uniref:hypothetical protein n=1 Tax=Cetobacterium sp. TaxID=2071632 RepID=UPI003EE474F7